MRMFEYTKVSGVYLSYYKQYQVLPFISDTDWKHFVDKYNLSSAITNILKDEMIETNEELKSIDETRIKLWKKKYRNVSYNDFDQLESALDDLKNAYPPGLGHIWDRGKSHTDL